MSTIATVVGLLNLTSATLASLDASNLDEGRDAADMTSAIDTALLSLKAG